MFYTDELQNEDVEQTQPATTMRTKTKPKANQVAGFVQDIQKGLQKQSKDGELVFIIMRVLTTLFFALR